MTYKPTIGLEIHAELKTQTKMFCNSKNDPNEKRPNVNICPVCLAHPGTLPVINKEAVRHVLKMGIAVNGKLADLTEFDRKNYFYPDLPKGYQISQYKYPLVTGGNLKGVEITRIHLEEDTARSTHAGGDYSLVDFNRAGVPLMELVTEPVVKSGEQAVVFAKELQLLLRYLGAGEANMEKGEMRVEANISVSDSDTFGTKVEIKNLNSFRAVERAISFEIERQSGLLEKGDKVIQETRGWDEDKQVTFSQRIKEESHDYRYFPDPDLPKLKISEIPEFSREVLTKELPKLLPKEKREQYRSLGIKDEHVEMYVRNTPIFVEGGEIRMAGVGTFFDKCLEFCLDDKELIVLVSNYIISDTVSGLSGVAKKLIDEAKTPGYTGIVAEAFPNAKSFVELIRMFKDKEINSRTTKDILMEIMRLGGNPREIAEKRGLLQISDEDTLNELVLKILKENPLVVKDYKAGKEASLQYLIGQGMKATRGAANPEKLKKLFTKSL